MIHGRNLLIYEGSPAVAIAACRSCSIVNKADIEEVSSPQSEEARTYKVGRISWEISVSTFVLAMKGYALRKGQTYFLTLQDRNNSSDIITGSAICTDVQITATKGNLVQGSISFLGLDDTTPAPAEPVVLGPDFNRDFNNDFLIE